MFRRSLRSKQFLALLPLTFFWSWAACALLCSETAANHHDSFSLSKIAGSEADCLSLTDKAEVCLITARTVDFQERQTIKTPGQMVSPVTGSPFRAPLAAWSALLPEIKQKSPPKGAPKLLLSLLCILRV